MRRGLLPLLALVVAVGVSVGVARGQGLTEDLSPELTNDADARGFAAISAAFTARLQERFPAGTPVSALRTVLRDEGFTEEGPGAARLEEQGFMCRLAWIVTWEADMGVLVLVEGRHDGICF